ncbi:MAG: collagen triple helix repeat-containing protein [Caudoviricetes sp.]|nr:MAG: collagen triple helix repeat-containing protein [Caudoviricetes sp.]
MSEDIGNASMQWVENLLTIDRGVVNGDISTVGNTLTLPLTELGIKITIKSTSTTSCSLTYYAIGADVTNVDIRRCTIWGGAGVETYTGDGVTVTSAGTVVDDTVYTLSNDTSIHFIRVNNIIYIVTVWISGNGARSSLIYEKIV